MIEKTIAELTAAITALTAQLATGAQVSTESDTISGEQAPKKEAPKKEAPKKEAPKKEAPKKKVDKVVEADEVASNEEVDITQDVLRELGMILLKAKKMALYNEIVTSFDAKKISELELGDYDACYTKLRIAVNEL